MSFFNEMVGPFIVITDICVKIEDAEDVIAYLKSEDGANYNSDGNFIKNQLNNPFLWVKDNDGNFARILLKDVTVLRLVPTPTILD